MSFAPSTTNYYSLTNKYTGPNNSLAAYPLGGDTFLTVAPSSRGNETAIQNWSFHPTGQNQYHICTTSTSPDSSLRCIDVINPSGPANASVSNRNITHLTTPQDVEGQIWTLTPSDDKSNSVKLTNDYSGPTLALDTYSDTLQVAMTPGDHTGQYWTQNELGECNGGQPCSGDVPGSSAMAPTDSQQSMGGGSVTATMPAPTTAITGSPAFAQKSSSGQYPKRVEGAAIGVLAAAVFFCILA